MAKKESAEPTTTVRTASIMKGIGNYKVTGVPSTVEGYDQAANQVGAALEAALDRDMAHRFAGQARSAFVELAVKTYHEQNPEVEIDKQGKNESDMSYINRLKEDGTFTEEFLKSLPEIEIEFSLTSQRSGINATYRKYAEDTIKYFGSAEEAASRLTNAGFECEATVDSIGAALKRKDEKSRFDFAK